jgi:hypothetical protein
MKSRLRTVTDWLLAPNVDQALKRLLDLATPPLRANRALRDRHRGTRRCFVIGNGPSLKGVDLTQLRDEPAIGANSFYKHPQAAAVNLAYLCIGDSSFMVDEPRSVAWHETIHRALPRATLVLDTTAEPLVERHGLYRGQEVFYVRRAWWDAHHARLVNLDFTRPLNTGQTTGTWIMIPLAMHLGFREVVLLGFDANWMESFSASYHFYERHESYPEFDSAAADGRGYSYEDNLEINRREFESHRLLFEHGRRRGVRIVNATAGGLLDMYPRQPLAEVLATPP